jgi:hypothetical protein
MGQLPILFSIEGLETSPGDKPLTRLSPINISFRKFPQPLNLFKASMYFDAHLALTSFECLSLLSFLHESLNDLPEILQELLSKLQLWALRPNCQPLLQSLACASDEQSLVSPAGV